MSQTKAQLIDGKVATVEFTGGAASTPSITFSGDTNTGIYSPGADQVAISTNGTGRLFVDSSGNAGLGVSPQRRLHIAGSDGAVSPFPTIGTRDFLLVDNNNNANIGIICGATSAGAIKFYNSSSTDIGGSGQLFYDFATTSIGLTNRAAGYLNLSTNNSERLRITTAGLVGVGTSSPASLLNLAGDNTAFRGQLSIQTSSASNFSQITFYDRTTFGAQIYQGYGTSNELVMQNILNGPLLLGTNNTERLRITSAGLVGIGTSAPGTALDVKGSVRSSIGTGTGAGGAGYALYQFGTSATATENWHIGSEGDGSFRFYNQGIGAGLERLRITSAGLVGIGTSAPAALVHSYQNSTHEPSLTFNNGSLKISTGSAVQLAEGVSNNSPFPYWLQVRDSGNASRPLALNPSGGNVGIGTSAPAGKLQINSQDGFLFDASGAYAYMRFGSQFSGEGVAELASDRASGKVSLKTGSTGSALNTRIEVDAAGATIIYNQSGAERFRCDSSGRLLVGTSSARSNLFNTTFTPSLQLEGVNADSSTVLATRNTNDTGSSILAFAKSRGTTVGSNTVVQYVNGTASDDALGYITFQGSDGTEFVEAASIQCRVDGTPGANDMPGRLVFSTTADGASSPTERARITSGGYFKASNSGSYTNLSGVYHEYYQTANDVNTIFRSTNGSLSNTVLYTLADRAANSAYHFLVATSSWGGVADDEFRLRGDGNAFADGTWTGGGADYAEYFEWSDGNPDAEDRRGISVVLDGDKIREAFNGEDPIGVISGNPSIVGDAAWNKWSGKYLRDEFGTYILEDYEVTDEEGNTVTQQRRKLNPAYNPDVEYVPREKRPEWDCVGLMGKLRIRKGQVTGSRWIKMRDINDSVEEWLVR